MTRIWAGYLRDVLLALVLGLFANIILGFPAAAASFAAYMIDARTGETLYSQNADTPLAPASLTKMMTLYITFQEIQAGHVTLDTMITVSQNAANQAPSRLGLQAGQKIALRYLIRAAAVKSANDAAAAIGDYFAGSPEKWGARMTQTALTLGMTHSTFKNANGLPAKGHLSTAHDMTILGRHLFYDFPQYYSIFSRRSTDAGLATVANTNRKFLDAYEGADGIKTGYTGQAGFNLTASAERNGVRLIATVFGETSTPARNQKMAELLDMGFKKDKSGAGVKALPPQADPEGAAPPDTVLMAQAQDDGEPAATTVQVRAQPASVTLATSPRPSARPAVATATVATAPAAAAPAVVSPAVVSAAIDVATQPGQGSLDAQAASLAGSVTVKASAPAQPLQLATVAVASAPAHKAPIFTDESAKLASVPVKPEVVTRVSTSGGETWGISLGRYPNSIAADKALIQVQLSESATLGNGLRRVITRASGYDAVVMGLDRDTADLACRRLEARAVQCFTIGR